MRVAPALGTSPWPTLVHVLLVFWGLQSHRSGGLPVGSHYSGVEKQNPLPPAAGHTAFLQPKLQLALWVVSAHCQVLLCLLSANNPNTFSSGLLSTPSLPRLRLYSGLPRFRCRTLLLALLNSIRFRSLSRSIWIAFPPSNVPTPPHSLVSSRKLLSQHSILLPFSYFPYSPKGTGLKLSSLCKEE